MGMSRPRLVCMEYVAERPTRINQETVRSVPQHCYTRNGHKCAFWFIAEDTEYADIFGVSLRSL